MLRSGGFGVVLRVLGGEMVMTGVGSGSGAGVFWGSAGFGFSARMYLSSCFFGGSLSLELF